MHALWIDNEGQYRDLSTTAHNGGKSDRINISHHIHIRIPQFQWLTWYDIFFEFMIASVQHGRSLSVAHSSETGTAKSRIYNERADHGPSLFIYNRLYLS